MIDISNTWKKDYAELLFPIDTNEIKESEAFEIKSQNLPLLYKYRDCSPNNLENLKNDVVRLSTANSFNDPYDCGLTHNLLHPLKSMLLHAFIDKYAVGKNITEEEITKLKNMTLETAIERILGKEKFNEIKDELSEYLEDEIESIEYREIKNKVELFQQGSLVSCFSENMSSILMWSHYADNHKGFCIEYDFSKHSLTESLHPVIYSDKIFDISPYIIDRNRFSNPSVNIYAAINKSKSWSYEQEWRLVFQGTTPHNYAVPRAKSIFLGSKISNDDKQKLLKIANQNNISVYQMKIHPREYKLIPEQIK
ncbi:DUF2971 domain-containing protein [Bacillus anthracis]|uniref:DUF2971 domain-containing protein n=1 Tax=Bacillus anthracis TaxID=1392 RepID=UPI003D23D071